MRRCLPERVFSAHRRVRLALRLRIEHAQHLNLADIPRFAQKGVIASMHSIHAGSDALMVVARLGEQRGSERAYVWQTLIKSDAIVLDGTDTLIEDINPIANFYCGVTRAYGDGKTFFPAQGKTRLQEPRTYTRNNAYALFAENELGSLAPGKLADMDVFSANLLTITDELIVRTRVLYTVIGGKLVYQQPGADQWRSGWSFEPMPGFGHVN
ncbi:MAG: amidohydrolase family protein [Rudaea sp.]